MNAQTTAKQTSKMSQIGKTRYMVQVAMLGAAAVVLMFFDIPLPFAPSFYKIDLSEVPVLIGACQISNAVMVPNDTAAFLWNAFQQPRTISEVVAQALEEYEAAEDTIQNSALNFVHDTLRYALLEEVISL